MSSDDSTTPGPVLRVIPGLVDNEALIEAARKQLGMASEATELTVVQDSENDDDLDLHDLGYLAERLLKSAIAKIDFGDALEMGAQIVVEDPADARIIVSLIRQAEISVYINTGEDDAA